jgi:phytol kinase
MVAYLVAHPIAGMAVELTALVTLMVALRLYQRFGGLSPETSRKLYHISGGLTTLSFPWIFKEAWPVVILTAITIPTLLALKYVKVLKSGLGDVLYKVERKSFGEVYFPLSVCLLFVLSQGAPLLFSIPILILAFADTGAAIIGVNYGRLRYGAADGQKSTEGSVTFFVVAFLSVLVPLLLFTNTGRAETLLSAGILGLLVSMSEAIAWRGLDNLFIPLSSFFLLRALLKLDVRGLVIDLAVVSALSLFTVIWRRRTTLNGGALMGAILGAYLIWVLGGWQWLLVPFSVFVGYSLLLHKTELDSKRLINIQAVFSVASVGLLWLFLCRYLHRPELFYPFTIAFAAHIPMIGIVRHKYVVPGAYPVVVFVTNVLKGELVLLLAYVLFDGFSPSFALHALVGLLGISVAVLLFYTIQPDIGAYPTDAARWRREALCAASGSLLGLVALIH